MKNLLLAAMLFCTNIAHRTRYYRRLPVVLTQQEKNSVQTKYSIPMSIRSGLVKRIISGMYEILPTDVSMY